MSFTTVCKEANLEFALLGVKGEKGEKATSDRLSEWMGWHERCWCMPDAHTGEAATSWRIMGASWLCGDSYQTSQVMR